MDFEIVHSAHFNVVYIFHYLTNKCTQHI